MSTKLVDTTQTTIEGVRVGIGNFARREYQRADGTSERGLTATLFPEGASSVIVGVGSVTTLGGHRFVVEKVESPFTGRAYIEIAPAH